MATSSSDGPPAPDDPVVGSSMNALAESETVDTVEVSPPEQGGSRQEAGSESPIEEKRILSEGESTEAIEKGISPASDDAVSGLELTTNAMPSTAETLDLTLPEQGGGRNEAELGAPLEEMGTSLEGECTETIAKGIASVLGPVVRLFETRVDDVLKSQSNLEGSIDRLTRELDKLLEDTPLPLGAQHAAKLTGIRKRVGSLTETLRIIQGRINNMDHMLSREREESPWLSMLPLSLNSEVMLLRPCEISAQDV